MRFGRGSLIIDAITKESCPKRGSGLYRLVRRHCDSGVTVIQTVLNNSGPSLPSMDIYSGLLSFFSFVNYSYLNDLFQLLLVLKLCPKGYIYLLNI